MNAKERRRRHSGGTGRIGAITTRRQSEKGSPNPRIKSSTFSLTYTHIPHPFHPRRAQQTFSHSRAYRRTRLINTGTRHRWCYIPALLSICLRARVRVSVCLYTLFRRKCYRTSRGAYVRSQAVGRGENPGARPLPRAALIEEFSSASMLYTRVRVQFYILRGPSGCEPVYFVPAIWLSQPAIKGFRYLA